MTRTKIQAPYDGRVRSERVDIGQFVTRGSPIASIYATDAAEVRLPIHDDELAHIDLPLGEADTASQPAVILHAKFAGTRHSWEGRVVRTEGELDPATRMINVVARIDAPYKVSNGRPPLAVGLFVEAEIIGNQVDNVFVLPRSALQNNRQVYAVTADDRLQFRDVIVLRIVDEDVYVSDGINAGDTLSLSTVTNAIEGMKIRRVNEAEIAAK